MNLGRLSRSLPLALLLLPIGCAHDLSTPPVVPTSEVGTAVTTSPPAKAAVATLSLDATPSLSVVSTNGSEMFVRLRVTGLALSEAKRPPINLALVIDTSGSMEGAAIEHARKACATMVDEMSDGDWLSVVSFGSRTELILPSTQISAATKTRAKAAVEGLKAEGTTDMVGGLTAGLGELHTHWAADGINRMVLMSDGVPNDPTGIPALTAQANQMQVHVTSLGLGPDFEETLMASLARDTGGTFHFVQDGVGVAQVFDKEIAKMDRLVAKNAFVDVTPGPGVVIEAAFGAQSQPVGRNVRLTVGDLGEAQVRDVILRVKLPAHGASSKVEVLDAALRYADSAGRELSANTFVGVGASSDPKAVADSANAELEHQAASLRVADDIVRAIASARQGDLPGARSLLDQAASVADDGGRKFNDPALAAKAKEARELKRTVVSLVPAPSQGPLPVDDRKPQTAPSPMPIKPEEAMGLKSAHSEAMTVLQGE